MDAFGPVSDNANGIGEMAGLEPKARQTLADLDAVGNTTKAITKGIAIASAVLAAVALFASFYFEYDVLKIDMIQWKVFVAFLIGGAIPFLFSSLTIAAVGRAAYHVVNEVRWQFANIKGLWEGKADPDYGPEGTAHPGAAGHSVTDSHRLPLRAGGAGRLSGRGDPGGAAHGGVPGQRRRRLGQRQEDH
jgi:hypothetical protein